MLRQLPRLLSRPLYNQAVAGQLGMLHTSSILSSSKSDLAQLRKKTGYSLSICKKALSENNDDIGLAEKWLREQAQAQGWAKAQKLQGRNTAQGLLGLRLQPSAAILAELNCETDFVAKNKKFISLLDLVTDASLQSVLSSTPDSSEDNYSSGTIKSEEVGKLGAEAGKSLADVVALNIGQLGENMALGDVNYLTTSQGSAVVRFAGFAHPNVDHATSGAQLFTGRYAAVMAYTCSDKGVLPEGQTAEGLAKQICQHIIGMAPTAVSNEEEKESSLLHQTFLLDEEYKVGELVQAAGINILTFVRREVGRAD